MVFSVGEGMVLGEVAVLGKLEEALQVLNNLMNPIRSMCLRF